MTQTSSPWDGILIGDAADAPYSATEWASLWNWLAGIGARYPNYGVLKGSGAGNYQPLNIHATSPATTNITVEIGSALVNGRLYRNSAAESLTIQANSSGNPRVDTVILRVDFVAQTVRLVVKQGSPAGSPVRPSLQQDASFWEIPLADISVANGFATIGDTAITQRQRYVGYSSAGWQPYAFPIGVHPEGTFNNPITIAANGGTIVVPIPVAGNLSLAVVHAYVLTTAVDFNIGAGIYVQDNQDIASTPDNTLRLLAEGSSSGTFGGAAAVRGITITNNPILLTPGLYWLALQNRHATNAFALGSTATSAITQTTARTKTTTNPNGATLDFSNTGGVWTTQTAMMGVWLRGMVYGDVSPY